LLERTMAVYDALAAEYEHGMARVTALHAADLAGALGVRRGDRILDVAAGTGAVTEALAARTGDEGLVVATDVAAGMLAFARRRFDGAGVSVRYVLSAAESLPFADQCFDGVACGFGIQHMADVEAALGSMRRVLRPGGRCVVSVWDVVGKDIKTPINDAFTALSRSQSLSPAQEEWSASGTLSRRLQSAGFVHVEIMPSAGSLAVSDLDEWWHAVTSGRFGSRLRAAGEEHAGRVREEAYRRAEGFADRAGDGWRFPSSALLGIGAAP
jgi:ubiquinone/menaquinone biosynthesis C-methylase UbiE